jgi:hypothetical protein
VVAAPALAAMAAVAVAAVAAVAVAAVAAVAAVRRGGAVALPRVTSAAMASYCHLQGAAFRIFFFFLGRGFTIGQAAQRAPQKTTDPALAGSVRTRCPRTHNWFAFFFGEGLHYRPGSAARPPKNHGPGPRGLRAHYILPVASLTFRHSMRSCSIASWCCSAFVQPWKG